MVSLDIKKTAFLTLSDHETPHSGEARLTGAEPIKPDSQNRHFSDAPELSAHVEARARPREGVCRIAKRGYLIFVFFEVRRACGANFSGPACGGEYWRYSPPAAGNMGVIPPRMS